MIIQLPFPHDALWPNARPHWGTKSTQTRRHKKWAHDATLAVMHGEKYVPTGEKIPVRIIVSSRPKGPECDSDNAVAAAKAYLDGIALALGVNDRIFDAPIVRFSGRRSNFTIELIE